MSDQRFSSALGKLEEAQNLIEEAAEQLCSVDGAVDLWEKTCELRDVVQQHWYAIKHLGHRLAGQAELRVHRDYDAEMRLPEGLTCKDCQHARRCFSLGYSRAPHTSCDFHPSRFLPKAQVAEPVTREKTQ